MSGKIIGLDLSLTSTGIVVFEQPGNLLDARAIVSRTKGMARIENLLQNIIKAVDTKECNLWVLEGYGFASYNAAVACELGGIIKFHLWRLAQNVLIVPPSSLKKFATGKGNIKKDQMRLHVYKRWGFEHDKDDVVDAYALARMGIAWAGLEETVTVAQKDAVKKMTSSEDYKFVESGKATVEPCSGDQCDYCEHNKEEEKK